MVRRRLFGAVSNHELAGLEVLLPSFETPLRGSSG